MEVSSFVFSFQFSFQIVTQNVNFPSAFSLPIHVFTVCMFWVDNFCQLKHLKCWYEYYFLIRFRIKCKVWNDCYVKNIFESDGFFLITVVKWIWFLACPCACSLSLCVCAGGRAGARVCVCFMTFCLIFNCCLSLILSCSFIGCKLSLIYIQEKPLLSKDLT